MLALVPAGADAKPATPPKVMNSPPYVEQLIAQPPKGWIKVWHVNVGDTRVTDFVPKGETRKHWKAKLSFESYTKLLPSDPLIVINEQVKYDKMHCSFVKDYNLFSGLENNYQTSMKLIMCGKLKKTGKGQVTLFKAIKGKQYFYVVRMVRRLPPFKAGKSGFDKTAMAAWSHYFSQIRVCYPGTTKHPCPKPDKH